MVDLVERLRADLTAAIRSRETDAARVLRSTLAAVANAEARPVTTDGRPSLDVAGGIAGATAGLAATEAPRRTLTADEVAGIIATERDDCLEAAADVDRHGAAERAASLRTQAAVLDRYLSPRPPGE